MKKLNLIQNTLYSQWAYLFKPSPHGEAWASQETWDKVKRMHTNVYVWGEGF